jgi:hypothetical protein
MVLQGWVTLPHVRPTITVEAQDTDALQAFVSSMAALSAHSTAHQQFVTRENLVATVVDLFPTTFVAHERLSHLENLFHSARKGNQKL